MNAGVIVAGGAGRRLPGPMRKQYLGLCERPILAHVLSNMAACDIVHMLVLAVPSEDYDYIRKKILPLVATTKKVRLVTGGSERQESVANALKAVPKECGIVAIHDGVRPFASSAAIGACIQAAKAHGAAILAIPAFDTLKRVDQNGLIETTIPRQKIWLAQTPQAFQLELIKKAHARAKAEGFLGTDDASLVERMGHKVKVIAGSRDNIKVTTPEDLTLAQAIHRMMRK
jgi:2-C-methyl-D-erythritol 4-phosphate cytidylyltransferase